MDSLVDAELEQRFDARMWEIYKQAKDRCGYNAERFRGLLARNGGRGAAKRLLESGLSFWSPGLTTLWKCGCLDLTVEAQVVKSEFAPLFSEKELGTAQARLRELGYDPPAEANH